MSHPPWPRTQLPPDAPVDVDVAVVGGGPAGMTAAIRARWVKSFHTVCCSVAVFEPGRLGGLATWRTASISGPGYRYIGDGLKDKLQADFARYHIPVITERVTDVTAAPHGFTVVGAGGTRVRARSVILAAGMRPLSNEARFIQRGLFITYMGYSYFPRILDRAAEAADGKGLVVVGNPKSSHIAGLVAARAPALGPITWVLEGTSPDQAPDLPGRVILGRLDKVLGAGDDHAGFDAGSPQDPSAPDYERPPRQGVTGVTVVDHQGQVHTLTAGAVFLDYNAFELRPALTWDRLGLAREAGGFVRVDRWCATSVPGVFAAGDVTGRYASTAMALGDGVNAGFGAVKHVHQAKFGHGLNLFAYQPSDRVVGEHEAELPALRSDLVPVLLVPRAAVPERLRDDELLGRLDGVRTLADVGRVGLIRQLIEQKLVTVH